MQKGLIHSIQLNNNNEATVRVAFVILYTAANIILDSISIFIHLQRIWFPQSR